MAFLSKFVPIAIPIANPIGIPKGNPIPVGEGWWMLMLLALGYAPLRLKKKPKPL